MKTKYGLYIARQSEVVRIPVNPTEYPIERESNAETYNVLGIGEIIIPRLPKLRVISWDSYFPVSRDDPLALNSGGFWPPKKYVELFNSLLEKGEIVRFIANRYTETGEPLFDTNIQCIVTSFEATEKGGTTGDIWYTLELTEYRSYTPATVQIQVPSSSTGTATVETQPSREVPAEQIVVGSIVLCNGNYYYSSYKDEPHGTFSNFRGKVAKIVTTDPTRACPYLIVTESGGGMGWVAKSQIQVISS